MSSKINYLIILFGFGPKAQRFGVLLPPSSLPDSWRSIYLGLRSWRTRKWQIRREMLHLLPTGSIFNALGATWSPSLITHGSQGARSHGCRGRGGVFWIVGLRGASVLIRGRLRAAGADGWEFLKKLKVPKVAARWGDMVSDRVLQAQKRLKKALSYS